MTSSARPVVAVCTGHRCAALFATAGVPALPDLRSAVRSSEQSVLVSTGCVGACAQAPVVGLSTRVDTRASRPLRDGGAGQTRLALQPTAWLGPMGRTEVQALCRWVTDDGAAPLPAELVDVRFVPGAW